MNFGTSIINNNFSIDKNTGALSIPIYQASTFQQDIMEEHKEYIYSRSGNPTRKALEETISFLEKGDRGFAFSTGLAAISAVFSIFSSGDHIVVCEDVYGGTYRMVTTIFNRYKINASFVDVTDLDLLKSSIKQNTKAIFLESPSNPLLKITDLKRVISIAKECNLLVIIDNTFMSPYLQRPIILGADIVIHSATKFIGGHSDVMGGLVVVKGDTLANNIYFIQNSMGAVLGPFDCWLNLRGIKTLKVRMDYQQKSAQILAEWLKGNDKTTEVYFPGIKSHKNRDIHFSQADGAGSVLSFKLKNEEYAKQFISRVKIPKVAISLGGVETIISYPVKMSHASMPFEKKESLGITGSLIRVSVGLEDIEDIIKDFNNAMMDMD